MMPSTAMKSAPLESTAAESTAAEAATAKRSNRVRAGEMTFSEVPPIKVVIASLEDYPATIVGAEVTDVRAGVRAIVRTRTIARGIIAAGATAQQKSRHYTAGQKKLSACVHTDHSRLSRRPAWRH